MRTRAISPTGLGSAAALLSRQASGFGSAAAAAWETAALASPPCQL
jgi:hypothetical protein